MMPRAQHKRAEAGTRARRRARAPGARGAATPGRGVARGPRRRRAAVLAPRLARAEDEEGRSRRRERRRARRHQAAPAGRAAGRGRPCRRRLAWRRARPSPGAAGRAVWLRFLDALQGASARLRPWRLALMLLLSRLLPACRRARPTTTDDDAATDLNTRAPAARATTLAARPSRPQVGHGLALLRDHVRAFAARGR